MRFSKPLATLLLAVVSSLMAHCAVTWAAINAQNLGANYDQTTSNITFRVYSSQATRIEVYLYAGPFGAQEAAKYALAKDASNVWSITVSVSALRRAEITGPVFYGYRA